MGSTIVASPALTALEDVLAHLPVSTVTGYRKGQIIYSPELPSAKLYLITSGKVALSRIGEGGVGILLDIIATDELFGEAAFCDVSRDSERATAHENTLVMAWDTSEIESLISQRPRLAVALVQTLAQRNFALIRRIESLAVDTIEQRLARSLIRFSERLGTRQEDGSVQMLPLTHALLARYIGSSRELVTRYMNQLRKQGYLKYSRKGIQLYRDALKASLSMCALPAPGGK